jgi:excisionase family DNA binding protein
MESMMTARQVAELLGVHENWVYDQAVSGALPSYKIGGSRRFDPDELRRWIAGNRQPENTGGPRGRTAHRTAAATAARRGAQHEERQSEPEQSTRARRRSGDKAGAPDDKPQPRLFEI